jgi:hypothetical protein
LGLGIALETEATKPGASRALFLKTRMILGTLINMGSDMETNPAMTPFEIRLELLKEARIILQCQADLKQRPAPTEKEIIEVAKTLNVFVSARPDRT